jgi:hypothetical protein
VGVTVGVTVGVESLEVVSFVTGFSTARLEGSLLGVGFSSALEVRDFSIVVETCGFSIVAEICGFSTGFEISGTGLATSVGVAVTLTGVLLATLEDCRTGFSEGLAASGVVVTLEAGFGATTTASVVTARGSGASLVKSSKLPADLTLEFLWVGLAVLETLLGWSMTVLAF